MAKFLKKVLYFTTIMYRTAMTSRSTDLGSRQVRNSSSYFIALSSVKTMEEAAKSSFQAWISSLSTCAAILRKSHIDVTSRAVKWDFHKKVTCKNIWTFMLAWRNIHVITAIKSLANCTTTMFIWSLCYQNKKRGWLWKKMHQNFEHWIKLISSE